MSAHHVVEPTGRRDRPSTVFIAPEDLLAKWRERPETPTDLLAFADKDVQHAVDIIRRDQPRVVVFDQIFASTSVGAAVVDDLCADPRLARTDIRLLEAAHSASLGTYGPTTGLALANLAKTLARRPLRQASRVKMPVGSNILVDGSSAILVDISTSGAQVVSSTILKPNQRVRLVVTTNGTAGRSAGSVGLVVARDGAGPGLVPRRSPVQGRTPGVSSRACPRASKTDLGSTAPETRP